MAIKNNPTKIPSKVMNRFIPITPHGNVCKSCHKQASILYGDNCAKCLKLEPLGDFQ